ncbi:MAG: hypothetical protein VX834_06370 [Myxococcota bacterium]|nr:hypothetical protein [Myxococcota bacterium]
MQKLHTLILALITSLGLSGCSTLYGVTGDVLSNYAVDHMAPYVLASEDIYMACEDGRSIGNLLMSFERVTDAPDKAAIMALVSAGMCGEFAAYEAELAHVRHLNAGRVGDATDARILQQRLSARAASRFARAYERLVAAYGEPGDSCPELSESDEVLYLLGLSGGMLGLLFDRTANGVVGVDMGIPAKVLRASECLDDQRWYGIPGALKGALYTSIPGSAPEGVDPWKLLDDAATKGEQTGVRLARALQIKAAIGAGKTERNREYITSHFVSLGKTSAPERGRLLDLYATTMIQHFSDVIWVEDTGHRTPLGQSGTFWKEPEADSGEDDDLLDGLE